jgi:hypothetical protein
MQCNIQEDQNPKTQKQLLNCSSLLRMIRMEFFMASNVICEMKPELSEIQTLSTCCVNSRIEPSKMCVHAYL